MNSSDPVFFTDIASKSRAKTIFTLNSQKIISKTSEVSKIGENKTKIYEKMIKIVPSNDKIKGKSSEGNSRGNSLENQRNKDEKSKLETAPPPLRLLSATFGTVEVKYHRRFKKISFEKIKWQRSAHMPYGLDPRRVKQLRRECVEELMTKAPVINGDDNDVVISKMIIQKIKEDKSSKDKGPLERDTHPKSPEILVDNGDNICTTDVSTRDPVGEDVVSSTDCGEQGERCSPEADEERIDSSLLTASNSPEYVPDSSLDSKTVKGILKIPELLDENRGASHSNFVMRKDIKFNSSKGRYIKESQEIEDKRINSDESSAKDNKEIIMGLNLSIEKTKDSSIQEENPKQVSLSSPQLSSNDNPALDCPITASPMSSHDKSLMKEAGETSEEFSKVKSSEKEERSSLSGKIKKRKEESSDSNKVKGNEVPKSSGSSSKEKSSEPDAKKKKKLTPDEDSKEFMRKKESLDNGKSHKDKESYKKHKSSSTSLTTDSKKRKSSGSRSSSQEPHRKKHRTSESSSGSRSTPEKVYAKVKLKDASLKRIKTEEPSTPSAVNESKEDTKKKPTPIGSSKKGRVSRLNLDRDSGTSVTGKIKETLDRIKVKDKTITEPRKSTSSVNQSTLHKKTIGETTESSSDCRENKMENQPLQQDKVEEKPEMKFTEELKKESHDHQKNEKNVESMGKEALKQKAPEKNSAQSGAHVPGDYLGRRLAKIARDEIEKEKKILSEIPKPASAVPRKKKVSTTQVTAPTAPAATDILAINASVPIDVHLFENIDKEPLPPAPPVLANKVFPHVLPENSPERTNQIPLICENSIPLNNLMNIDSLEREDYDETCSLNSVETVILKMSPKEPELKKFPPKEDVKDFKEIFSLEEKISHWKSQELEFERLHRELELLETPPIKENTAVEQKPLNNNPDNNNLDKLVAKDPKNFELKPHNEVVILAEAERPEKKHHIQPPMKSQPVMPFILMPIQALLSEHNHLQKEEKEITILYEDVIHLIQVIKHHKQRMETMPVLEFQTHVKSLCDTFKKSFDILKKKEKVITDEEMIQLIVEHSLHLSSPWHVKSVDVLWILRNSPVKPIAPVPPPYSHSIPKIKEKLHVHNKNMINHQFTAEQSHQQHHHLHIPKNEGLPTNTAVNSSANSHPSNNRVPHSERVISNQRINLPNDHCPKLPRPMPNFNYESPDQKKVQMNVNLQQPPLPDQPFPRAPPPPPPPPPPPAQPAPLPQNSYKQLNYNNQYQQFMQNEQLVSQQMQNIPQLASNNPPQSGPYIGPSYFNQYQFIKGQVCVKNMIPQFSPQRHIPAPLYQESYPVPPLSMENIQCLNAIIPEELNICYSGRCKHVNCEKYLKFQQYLRMVKMNLARTGQLPPQPVFPQLAGLQAQHNRDPRWRGAQVPQPQVCRQSPLQKSPGNMIPRVQPNPATLQQLNQLIQPPQRVQNQGPPQEYRDRLHPEYPPCLQGPQSELGSVGSQMNNSSRNETFENQLKTLTPNETHPDRFSVVKPKEMTYSSNSLTISMSKISTKPSTNPNNTSKPSGSGSPLNLSTDKNLKPSEPPALHSDVKENNSKYLINHEEVRQKRIIDVITVSSSEDEEESEPKRLNKNPELSRVDDEIECVGIAKELGIKLDNNFPVIGTVMTIPMTDFEKMNIIMEKEEDQMIFKEEIPMENQEVVPMGIGKEEVLCITCEKKTAVAYCCKCDKELFCSASCAEKSDHFASCILIVKIEDD